LPTTSIYKEKHYAEAIIYLTKALAFDPHYARAYNNRGLAYYGLKDYGQAIADYDRALALDPKLARAYNNRGYASLWLKDAQQAAADFQQAATLDQGNLNAAWMTVWVELGKEQPSTEVITQLPSFRPK